MSIIGGSVEVAAAFSRDLDRLFTAAVPTAPFGVFCRFRLRLATLEPALGARDVCDSTITSESELDESVDISASASSVGLLAWFGWGASFRAVAFSLLFGIGMGIDAAAVVVTGSAGVITGVLATGGTAAGCFGTASSGGPVPAAGIVGDAGLMGDVRPIHSSGEPASVVAVMLSTLSCIRAVASPQAS